MIVPPKWQNKINHRKKRIRKKYLNKCVRTTYKGVVITGFGDHFVAGGMVEIPVNFSYECRVVQFPGGIEIPLPPENDVHIGNLDLKGKDLVPGMKHGTDYEEVR